MRFKYKDFTTIKPAYLCWIEKANDIWWIGVLIDLEDKWGLWIVPLHGIGQIMQEIGKCEDLKYPPNEGYLGARMTADYIARATLGEDLESLASEFKLERFDKQNIPIIKDLFPKRIFIKNEKGFRRFQ